MKSQVRPHEKYDQSGLIYQIQSHTRGCDCHPDHKIVYFQKLILHIKSGLTFLIMLMGQCISIYIHDIYMIYMQLKYNFWFIRTCLTQSESSAGLRPGRDSGIPIGLLMASSTWQYVYSCKRFKHNHDNESMTMMTHQTTNQFYSRYI